MSTGDYELLDFGRGRKLERFGPYLLDRLAPAAKGVQSRRPELWKTAAARFVRRRDGGEWRIRHDANLPESWTVKFGPATLELRLTPFGHVGVFPDHAQLFDGIAERIRSCEPRPKVLNLFAYTGGATLAAATAGAEVVHVDAARNAVAWARRNAELSGLSEAPIRWVVEDAAKFVGRELRRGARYDGVILDPPTYGHGPKGQVWKLREGLVGLLADCRELVGANPAFFLLTCHTADVGPEDLRGWLREAGFPPAQSVLSVCPMKLAAADERSLATGLAATFDAPLDSTAG